MIKQFIDKLLGKAPGKTAASKTNKMFGTRKDVGAQTHRIDPNLVDRRALDVVSTLQHKGFEAYIVGGAVRDLLLGLRPKDFDVATNATPEQVKALFRRAFIIGKRFRIVHVVFGRGRDHEVIEVTTFRAYLDNQNADRISGNEKSTKALAGMQHAVDENGRVLRDNVWGSLQEDAARRDFTINAMYYDPRSQIVVDFHRGIEDAKKHTIRMIGDPDSRYREDPVRILRAIRFAAKLRGLGFHIDARTSQPLQAVRPLLEDIPPSRMFDEMLKLVQTGHAMATVAQLRELQLDKGIYPLLDLIVERSTHPLVELALQDTDRRVGEGKSVAPSFLLACVLWDDILRDWQRAQQQGDHAHPALAQAIGDVFDRRVGDVSGRGKLAADMREIWMMQPRFERRTGKAPYSLLMQPRFRAGLDFMRLRARAGEPLQELVEWWETFSMADDAERADLIDQAKLNAQKVCKTGSSKRKPRKPAATRAGQADVSNPQAAPHEDSQESPSSHEPTGVEGDTTAAPKKRRRRRKKPANSGNASPDASGQPLSDD